MGVAFFSPENSVLSTLNSPRNLPAVPPGVSLYSEQPSTPLGGAIYPHGNRFALPGIAFYFHWG
eukprot:1263994-Pyramimonas_sp.AAC.1